MRRRRTSPRSAAALVLCGAMLILTALSFESAILLVPGTAFVVLGAWAPLWAAAAIRPARVGRVLHAERVVEGQPLEATLVLRHGWLGLTGCEITDPLVSRAVSVDIPPSARRRQTELRIVARFERRGRRVLGTPELTLEDPLGILRLHRRGEGDAQEVLVLPRTERVRPIREGFAPPLESLAERSAAEPLAATDVDGLRTYRRGTPASRIHWPALARGAGLLERRLNGDAGMLPLLVIDPRHDGPPELLDAAVRAVASLALELARRGGCELLVPGQRRTIRIESGLRTWPSAHARLALLEGGGDAPAPALPPSPGAVFYVAARPVAPSGLRLDRLGAVVLVVPGELAARIGGSPVFEVAGCVGFALAARGHARGHSERGPGRSLAARGRS